ncbi:MAG: hypothetical protein PHH77_05075 [Victivallaceae bacterium]|nr:hypothetical protein [Victivallaceae bacterium]
MIFEVKAAAENSPVTIRECYPVKLKDGKCINDALPILETLKIPPFESREVWISVDSRNLTAGTHETELSIKSKEIDYEVKLELEVYPVKLPDCDKNFPLYTFVFDYLETPWPNRRLSPELKKAAIEDLRKHYITVPYLGVSSIPWPAFDKNGDMNIDFSSCDEAIELWKKEPCKMLAWYWHFYLPRENKPGESNTVHFGKNFMSTEWKKRFSAWLPEFIAHLKEKGLTYDDFYFHVFDETTGDDLKETAKLIKQIDPKVKLFTSVLNAKKAERIQEIQNLTPVIDIFCPAFHFVNAKDVFNLMRKKNGILWAYYNPPVIEYRATNPYIYYRLPFWHTWKNMLQGCGIWTYWVAPHISWNSSNSGKISYDLVYSGSHAPPGVSKKELIIPSKRWEAWREGVEDYLYLDILDRLTKQAEAAGVAAKTVRAAQVLIAEEVKKVTENSAGRELADHARRELLEKILELRGKISKK